MVRSTSDVAARFTAADCTDQSAVEALLADANPDVIVQCASLMSPWALVDARTTSPERSRRRAGRHAADAAAGRPCSDVRRPRDAFRRSGREPLVSGRHERDPRPSRSRADDRTGQRDDAAAACPRRASRRARPDAELPLVRVIGHHNQVYPVMRAEPPADPNDRVRVFLGEEGERADIWPTSVILTRRASSTTRSLPPPASTSSRRFCRRGHDAVSAPAPFGLPGGYPVVIDGRSDQPRSSAGSGARRGLRVAVVDRPPRRRRLDRGRRHGDVHGAGVDAVAAVSSVADRAAAP